MTAIETLLTGRFDYAGLYPPAGLDMSTAVSNYRDYQGGPHAFALGRFIVDIARADELREAAGDAFSTMPLSMIAPPEIDPQRLSSLLGAGFRIESVEIKCAVPATIAELGRRLPKNIERYIEVPIQGSTAVLDALAASHMRAKLRMGGVVPEAFPAAKSVVAVLKGLADRNIAFKATAGLHHPIRSRHSLTYAPDSTSTVMHGFLNFACAAALLHFRGSAGDALNTLEEEDSAAWHVTPETIRCGALAWTSAQLSDMRRFCTSLGSCSFTEPIGDLEVLGWL